MAPTHIPPDAVRLINALAAQPGVPAPDAEVDSFRALCAGARKWLEFTRGYIRDDPERGRLDNLGVLWDEVEGALSGEKGCDILPRLVPPLYQAIHAMDEINRERARSTYSRQPALNDFIAAGVARLEGRAEMRAVTDRLGVIQAWAGNLAQLYHGVEERLLPEVRAEIERGLAWLDQALADAAQATEHDDPEGLRGALADLTKAETIVQAFLEWDQADQERVASRHTRFRIPLIGAQLELALESARKVPRGAWVPAVRTTQNLLLPQFRAFWEQRRSSILMPAAARDGCLAAVDQGIEALDAAVANLLRPRYSEQFVLAEFEQALTLLSDAMVNLENQAFRDHHLTGTDAETWWEILRGVLAKSVPDEALIELVRENPPPPSWAPVVEKVKAYLETRDELLICDAAEALLEQVPPADKTEAQQWTCVFCGHANPSGEPECSGCRQRGQDPQRIEGWQA